MERRKEKERQRRDYWIWRDIMVHQLLEPRGLVPEHALASASAVVPVPVPKPKRGPSISENQSPSPSFQHTAGQEARESNTSSDLVR